MQWSIHLETVEEYMLMAREAASMTFQVDIVNEFNATVHERKIFSKSDWDGEDVE